jgi:hypothetical protein
MRADGMKNAMPAKASTCFTGASRHKIGQFTAKLFRTIAATQEAEHAANNHPIDLLSENLSAIRPPV